MSLALQEVLYNIFFAYADIHNINGSSFTVCILC